jgi:RND family efflux transporter MFP subunit
MIRAVLGLALVVATLAVVGCRRSEPTRQEPQDASDLTTPVAAIPAATGNVRSLIRATGVVTPAEGAEFLAVALEPSRILEVPRAEGDAVNAGDVLVRFDTSVVSSEISRRRADVERARAIAEQAQITQERTRELFDRGIVSRREMENADRETAESQAELRRAEAARIASEESLARGVVRAPFAGVIAQRFHGPGDLVQGAATDPILRLVDPTRLEIAAAVPVADASRVLPGTSARITSLPTPVPLVVGAPSPASRRAAADSIAVRLLFAQPLPAETKLPVDSSVDVEIDGQEHVGAVLIPVDAVIRNAAESAVMIAAGSIAERRLVVTGIVDDDRVEIVSGIRPGELVITRGHIGLTDGAEISVAVER